MFQTIIARAQRSVDSLARKYVLRLVAAVPFVIAAGFGTAAAAIKLTELYGHLTAYSMLAIGFAILGLLALAAIGLVSQTPEEAAVEEVQATAEPMAATTELPTAKLALTALGALGPAGLTKILGLLTRNLPLVAGALVLAYLMLTEAAERDRAAPDAAE